MSSNVGQMFPIDTKTLGSVENLKSIIRKCEPSKKKFDFYRNASFIYQVHKQPLRMWCSQNWGDC